MKWMGAASRLGAAVVLSFVATSAFAYGKKHAKSYVTSGLILQFDAIANNGWSAEAGDIHAANASLSLWKELVSDYTVKSTGTKPVFNDTYVQYSHNGCFYTANSITTVKNALAGKSMTVELFIRPSTYYNYAGWFQISKSAFSERYLTLEMAEDKRVDSGGTSYTPESAGGAFERVQYAATKWDNSPASNVNKIIFDFDTKVYQDQDLLATITVDSSGAHFSINNSETLHTNTGMGATISSGYVGIGRYAANYASGRIYAVRVYSRVLTDEERAQNYAIDRERFLGEGATIDLSAVATDGVTEVAIDDGAWSSSAAVNDIPCSLPASPTNVTLHARNTSAPAGAIFEWTGLPSDATYSDAQKSSVAFAVPARSLTVNCRTIVAEFTASSTDGETEFSLDGENWSRPMSVSGVYGTPTVTLHARNPNFAEGYFDWTGLPAGATFGDDKHSTVTFVPPAGAFAVTSDVRRASFTATSTDGETEFSLDGENWSSSVNANGVYATPYVTLYARNPNFAGAYFDWTGLPSGATFGDDENASATFVAPLGGSFAATCGARRASFSATADDAETEFSFDGVNWSSSLSLVDVFARSNITVNVRNTAGTGWAYFTWTGLPSDTVLADRLNTAATIAIPLDGATVTCGSIATYATNEWIGGSGSTDDPAMWSLGVVPAPNQDLVITNAAAEGATITVTCPAALNVRSLVVGGGDGLGAATLNFTHKGVNVVSGDVAVHSGGTITHELGGYSKAMLDVKYTVNLSVGGNMTIDSGAAIDVSSKGHLSGQGPTGAISYNTPGYGATHGGKSRSGRAAYDSALRPAMYGAGLGTKGGGIVRLSVSGTLTVNGKIRSDTAHGTSYTSGAGGAIWIDAGVLSGAGSITATAGDSRWGQSGAGGRIAIYQTNSSATDFSAYTGVIQAYGGRSYDGSATSDGRQTGAAGTIYLQAYGQDLRTSTLIIDNTKVATSSKNTSTTATTVNPISAAAIYAPETPLDAAYDCGEIGNIIVRNGGHAVIGANTIKVYGGIAVDNARFKAYSGTIELCGTGTATITGTNLFNNVFCEAPGKTIRFGTGANDEFRIADDSTLTLKGSSESPLVLEPAVAGETWKATLAPTAQSEVRYVTVDHSDASGGIAITALSSTDGGSNVNWSFPLPLDPGDTLTWNGTYSGLWADVANWTDKHGAPRLPVETDVVVIPAGCENYPTIMSDTLQNSIVVADGASLVLSNDARLDVTNVFTVAGTFTVADKETIFFSGRSLDFSGGVVNPANSTFTVEGNVDTTLDFGGCTFRRIYFRKSGGAVAVTGSLTAEVFDVLATNRLAFAFSEGTTVSAQDIYCRSRVEAGAATDALRLTGAGVWAVNVSRYQYFSGVAVSNCTATALAATADVLSTDLGGNVNWSFSSSASEWIGGTGDYDVPSNWYPAGVPGSGANVVISGINGASAVTASGNVTARSVSIGRGVSKSSLYVGGVLSTTSDLVVGTNATLTLTSPTTASTVGGNFNVLNGGTATHPALDVALDTLADADASGYRFLLNVAGSVTVEPKGSVTAYAKGYATRGDNKVARGPLGYRKVFWFDRDDDGVLDTVITNFNAGHASTAYASAVMYATNICYGSMFSPRTHGSAGQGYSGGGVVVISCGGAMRIDGNVDANAAPVDFKATGGYAGAGGSVWLTAGGAFSGSGSVLARGGAVQYDRPGAGGRIAIYAGSNAFSGTLSASSGVSWNHTRSQIPGAGTVLVKAGEYYDVKLDNDLCIYTANYKATYSNKSHYWTTFVNDGRMNYVVTDMPADDDVGSSNFKKVRLSVGHLSAVNLTRNLKIADLDMTINTGCIVRLNYNTLRVLSRTHEDAKGWAGASIERSTRLRGEILWCQPGFAVTVR